MSAQLDAALDEFLRADSLVVARAIVAAQPQLLGDDTNERVAERIRHARSAGDEATARTIAQLGDRLRLCRDLGVDRAFAMLVLAELLSAQSPDESRQILSTHLELLGPEADEVLAEWTEFARAEGDQELGQLLDEQRQALAPDHMAGPGRALAEAPTIAIAPAPPPSLPQPVTEPTSRADSFPAGLGFPVGLGALIAELERLRGTDQIARRVDLCQRALALAPRQARPETWGGLQIELGCCYLESRTDRAEQLEQAIGCFQRALEVFTKGATPSAWAIVQSNLSSCYSQRIRGDRAANLEQAIACSEAALEVRTRMASPLEWAESQNNLGAALALRMHGGAAADLERAIACFNSAAEVTAREVAPALWANIQNNLGSAHGKRTQGDRAEDLELAIAHYQAALEVRTRRAQPFEWAKTTHDLGTTYAQRLRGDQADNHEQAITCFQAALTVFTRMATPREWAAVQNDLGAAYAGRVDGDRADNLERAIACYRAALEVRTRQTAPLDWAATQHNLGNAHTKRVGGDRADNLEQAIGYYEAALEVQTRQTAPLEWATTQNSLGGAYAIRVRGDRADNLERAIGYYEAALEVRTRQVTPLDWAATQTNLGSAYARRIQGDRAENLEHALGCIQAALQVGTRQTLPDLWADNQNNLGLVYAKRLRGDRADNLERAIACYQAALEVRTRQATPLDWAATQSNLGNGYQARLEGDRAENLEQAIVHLAAALEVRTRQTAPLDWATTQHNLGNAYEHRDRGNRADNLERAIACYQAALEVRTRQATPLDWADTQHQLGNAYSGRLQGDRAENLERAIAYYQAALEIHTRQAWPFRWAGTTYSLANAYKQRILGERQDNLDRAIAYLEASHAYFADTNDAVYTRNVTNSLADAYGEVYRWADAARTYLVALSAAETLYEASLSLGSKDVEIAEMRGLHAKAAYALAQDGKPDEAVVVLERGRTRRLAEALARDRADLAEAAQRDPEAYRAFRRAAERLQALESRERSAAPDDVTAHQVEATRTELAGAVQRFRDVTGFERFLTQPRLGDVVAVAEPGVPLAYLAATPAGSLALLVRGAGDNEPEAVELVPRGTEDMTSGDLLDLLVSMEGEEAVGYLPGQYGDLPMLEAALLDSLPVLGERLLGPLAARLRELGATGIVLVPVGLLGVLPLHAAPYQVGDGQRCLLDEFDVGFAPSARVLTAARAAEAAIADRPPLLAGVGNPSLDLGFARAELEDVAARFPGAVRTLYGDDATSEHLLAALSDASHIHLACHGLYDMDDALASHLRLAGSDKLTLKELLEHRYLADVRLVVASACQTAVAEFWRLPDEAIGLPGGFLQAGAAGVIATLWPVNDLSTSLLMTRFYTYHLHGDPETGQRPQPPVRALRMAQRWLRDLTGKRLLTHLELHPQLQAAAEDVLAFARLYPAMRPYARPIHWAPYVMVGA